MILLLDTNICSEILRGNEAVAGHLAGHAPSTVRLCSVVYAELQHGARASRAVASNLRSVEAFCSPFESLPFTDDCARVYGQVRATLQGTGQMMGSNDLMIAATAISTGATLVTNDVREFSRVPDLQVVSWPPS